MKEQDLRTNDEIDILSVIKTIYQFLSSNLRNFLLDFRKMTRKGRFILLFFLLVGIIFSIKQAYVDDSTYKYETTVLVKSQDALVLGQVFDNVNYLIKIQDTVQIGALLKNVKMGSLLKKIIFVVNDNIDKFKQFSQNKEENNIFGVSPTLLQSDSKVNLINFIPFKISFHFSVEVLKSTDMEKMLKNLLNSSSFIQKSTKSRLAAIDVLIGEIDSEIKNVSSFLLKNGESEKEKAKESVNISFRDESSIPHLAQHSLSLKKEKLQLIQEKEYDSIIEFISPFNSSSSAPKVNSLKNTLTKWIPIFCLLGIAFLYFIRVIKSIFSWYKEEEVKA